MKFCRNFCFNALVSIVNIFSIMFIYAFPRRLDSGSFKTIITCKIEGDDTNVGSEMLHFIHILE